MAAKARDGEGVEQRVAGGAGDVGGGQDDAIGEAEAFLFFLDEVAVEPGLQGAAGAVAGDAMRRAGRGRGRRLRGKSSRPPRLPGCGGRRSAERQCRPGVEPARHGCRRAADAVLLGGELGKTVVEVVTAEADAVVLGDDARRVALFVGEAHQVGVVAGGAGEGVGEVLGVHRTFGTGVR